MTVKLRFDGRVFVPDEPVRLPPGTEVTLTLPVVDRPVASDEERPLGRLVAMLDQVPDDPSCSLPSDLAAEHDHYLYGTPNSA